MLAGIICIIISILVFMFRRELEKGTKKIQKAILPEGVGWTDESYALARVLRIVGAVLIFLFGLYMILTA
jgi:cell division protein FtsX